MDCNPLGSSVPGILQARLLEWVVNSFSRGSSWPRDQIWVSHIAGRLQTLWVTRVFPKGILKSTNNKYKILKCNTLESLPNSYHIASLVLPCYNLRLFEEYRVVLGLCGLQELATQGYFLNQTLWCLPHSVMNLSSMIQAIMKSQFWLARRINFVLLPSWLGEDNDIPLQYSWLENPMYGGAW